MGAATDDRADWAIAPTGQTLGGSALNRGDSVSAAGNNGCEGMGRTGQSVQRAFWLALCWRSPLSELSELAEHRLAILILDLAATALASD
ncbi:MAG TPA: hypothetical protein IGS37_19910 [Synechococcales cyanobacterium M55_K2018_004]|nr:hypothetical protein [Synechococcales cyanobacterium M55_K2018_004]